LIIITLYIVLNFNETAVHVSTYGGVRGRRLNLGCHRLLLELYRKDDVN